jgi:hypothetical protein
MRRVSLLLKLAGLTVIAAGLLVCSVFPSAAAISAVPSPGLPKDSLVQSADCIRYCVRWVICYVPGKASSCVPCPSPCRSLLRRTCAEWATACPGGHF